MRVRLAGLAAAAIDKQYYAWYGRTMEDEILAASKSDFRKTLLKLGTCSYFDLTDCSRRFPDVPRCLPYTTRPVLSTT